MTSSAAVASPPPTKPSITDTDYGSDEIEYEEIEEEIEVEEEVEVEEEIDDDEQCNDGEIGQDLTPVPEENPEDDTYLSMEIEEAEEQINSDSATQGIPVSDPKTAILAQLKNSGDFKTSESSEKEELHVNGERTSRDTNPKTFFYESGEVNHAKGTPSIGDLNTAMVNAEASREKDNVILSVTATTNQNAVEVAPTVMQMPPRSHVANIRFRDPPSTGERENKKLRVACEFHAKGWCIKGSSCRFLHLKDVSDAAVKKSDVLESEASSSACIPPQQSGEKPILNSESEKLVLHKDDKLSAPLQAGRGSFGHNLYHGSVTGGSFTSHDNHHNTRISPFGTTLEEFTRKKSEILQNDPLSTELPYTDSRKPLSFGSSSWNANAFGTQNLLERGLEHRASVSSSLQPSISLVPRSEPESLSRNPILGNTVPAKYNTELSSNNWEPSVPFRPSHDITRHLLVKENLYDPLRDNIEQKNVKAEQVKFSNSDQGSSIKNINVQSKSSEEEEKRMSLVNVGNNGKDNILSSTCDNKVKFDKPTDKTALKVDGSSKSDGQLQSERAFRCFQSALVEFVKELVRPTWQEGLMSKDAHKVIVKKSVDKVLSTLLPHQIPSTLESTKLYLSSSQPKLVTLVEAYIEKYGKF